jgi:selenocysteine lyase/cysteine desulfurase
MPGRLPETFARDFFFSCPSSQDSPNLFLPSQTSAMNTVRHSSGDLLTGKLWRKDHTFISQLPFYSNIARMDDIAAALETVHWEGSFKTLLLVSFTNIAYLFL